MTPYAQKLLDKIASEIAKDQVADSINYQVAREYDNWLASPRQIRAMRAGNQVVAARSRHFTRERLFNLIDGKSAILAESA